MRFATRSRSLFAAALSLLVVFLGLLSGCQSSRPGFSFQPAPQRPARVETTAAPAATPAAVGTAVAGAPAAQPLPPQLRGQRKARRQASAARVAAIAKAVLAPKIGRAALLPRRALLQRPHATAEAGLGTTVLGVLGLIALPIAAVGLILSGGGLGWIIVGGLAALAVLVAYIDPFGR
ncbi:hypothetical protein [Hymenobacter daeguensis]